MFCCKTPYKILFLLCRERREGKVSSWRPTAIWVARIRSCTPAGHLASTIQTFSHLYISRIAPKNSLSRQVWCAWLATIKAKIQVHSQKRGREVGGRWHHKCWLSCCCFTFSACGRFCFSILQFTFVCRFRSWHEVQQADVAMGFSKICSAIFSDCVQWVKASTCIFHK